jgi:MatE
MVTKGISGSDAPAVTFSKQFRRNRICLVLLCYSLVSILCNSDVVRGYSIGAYTFRPRSLRPYIHPLIQSWKPNRKYQLEASVVTDEPIDEVNVDDTSGPQGVLPRIWPCGDDLDRRLIALSLPVIANFAIGPLIGAVDLFWVNRMGNALAVAGQAAANQVFNSVFWLTSFLPSVTATLIAKENAQGNSDGVQDAVCQALVVGMFLALTSSVILLRSPEQVLSSVLPVGAPALQYAKPYLLIRSFAFIPALISLVGFSAFRGILDTLTPVKISLFANVFNAILDPILIFTLAMGVPGGSYANSKKDCAT